MHAVASFLPREIRRIQEFAWSEIPGLVGDFRLAVGRALGVDYSEFDNAILKCLGFKKWVDFERVCMLLAKVVPHLNNNFIENTFSNADTMDDGDGLVKANSLCVAVIDFWANHPTVGRLAEFAERMEFAVDPIFSMPWGSQIARESDNRRGIEFEFLGSAEDMRKKAIAGFSLVKGGIPDSFAIELTKELIEHLLSATGVGDDERVPFSLEQGVGMVLQERGCVFPSVDRRVNISHDKNDFLAKVLIGSWKYNDVDMIPVGHLRGIVSAGTWREMGFSSSSPSPFQLLSFSPDDAYVSIRFGVDRQIIDGEDVCISWPHFAYVKNEYQIIWLSRCLHREVSRIRVISAAEAESGGVPHLAGWFVLEWS